MKEKRSPESICFQSSCEAVVRQDYKEAWSLLEQGLKEALRRFADQQDVVQLIAPTAHPGPPPPSYTIGARAHPSARC